MSVAEHIVRLPDELEPSRGDKRNPYAYTLWTQRTAVKLWKLGFNTYDIAKLLSFRKDDIHRVVSEATVHRVIVKWMNDGYEGRA